MGQSLSQIYIHLIFGTKRKMPLIQSDIKDELHTYLAGILKQQNSPAININSMSDHIHILFRLSKNHSLAKVVEDIKKSSSKWLKHKGVANFNWQNGYGAFSVSSSKLEIVKKYIDNQTEHHKKMTFAEEVELFMQEYHIENYNREYFWR